MSEQVPENFESDDQLAEWFEAADLSQYRLEQATDVVIANEVTLTITTSLGEDSSTLGATADVDLVST